MSSLNKKKKAKLGVKKAPSKKKAKVTKTKKVVKVAAAEKPKKAAIPKAAPKVKKAAEEKATPPKAVVKPEGVELGPPPAAVITARTARHTDDSSRERPARGFSFGELASAGVPLNAAKREGLSLDIRRRSVVVGNVDMLRGWFKSPRGVSAPDEAKGRVAVAAVSK
jgi:ribosomal protein L13E